MADIFVSYARSDRALVAPIVRALEAKGWAIWWDHAIAAGQEFDDRIEAELNEAKAVLVVWTSASTGSRWVRGEAHEAREAAELGVLAPVLEKDTAETVNWAEVDPDLDAIRELPRFREMMAKADARLANTGDSVG